MTETVMHIVGHIGTDVTLREVGGGFQLSTFRLATTPRHYDRAKHAFVDDPTNWLQVQCWRTLARNAFKSLNRGDPVIVVGKLKTQVWEKDGVKGSRFILEATAIGHDLNRGVGSFTKVTPAAAEFPDRDRAALEAAHELEGMTVDPPRPEQEDFTNRPLANASM